MTRNARPLICSLAIAAGSAAADTSNPSDLASRLRVALEQQFRTSTGLGFATFGCDLTPGSPVGREIACQAVDEEGDRFFYRITFGVEGGPPSVSTSQPVAQLAAISSQPHSGGQVSGSLPALGSEPP